MEALPHGTSRYTILGSTTILCTVLIIYATKLLYAARTGSKGLPKLSSLSATLQDGFLRRPGGVFEIGTSEGSEFVTSREAFNEIKGWSDDSISVQLGLQSFVQSKYTGQYPPDELLNTAIKADLSQNLTKIIPKLVDESKHAIETLFPSSPTWTPVHISHTLERLVARISARAFIGEELCRNEDWLDAILDYTEKLFVGVEAVKKVHPWLRPMLGHFLPEIRRISQVRRRCADHIKTLLEQRSHSQEDEYDDMLHWIIKRSRKAGMHDIMELATLQLSLSMAAVHSTSMTTTNILYDLAALPEYVEPLRSELENLLQEHGSITKGMLDKAYLLDSFMKESQRMNPLSFTTFKRGAVHGLQLSDGSRIPAGSIISAPVHAMGMDDRFFKSPETFDGYRYLRKREGAEGGSAAAATRTQFVSVTADVPSWGYGRHACPGRFFAALEIKLMVASILLRFDLRLEDGQTGRYENLRMGMDNIPDRSKTLMFRLRSATD